MGTQRKQDAQREVLGTEKKGERDRERERERERETAGKKRHLGSACFGWTLDKPMWSHCFVLREARLLVRWVRVTGWFQISIMKNKFVDD